MASPRRNYLPTALDAVVYGSALAAVHASGHTAGGIVPLVLIGALVLAGLLSATPLRRRFELRAASPVADVVVGVGVASVASFAVGWGVVAPVMMVVAASQCIRAHGSHTSRPAAAAVVANTLILQALVAAGALPVAPLAEGASWGLLLAVPGAVLAIRQVGRTVSELEEAERAAKANARAARLGEERFRSLVQNSSDVVLVTDEEFHITYVSPSIERVMGFGANDLLGRDSRLLLHPEDRGGEGALPDPSERAEWTAELRVGHADGRYYWHQVHMTDLRADPAVGGIVANHRDVTERRAYQERLAHDATHDALTGLPNRRHFIAILEGALTSLGEEKCAVLFVDVDRFKVVNDSLGHRSGDALLAGIAKRLQRELRPSDVLARFGGDEFTVLLRGVPDSKVAENVAVRLVECARQPLILPDGHEVQPTISVGVAVSDAGSTADDLIHDADVAMYRAKSNEGDRAERYDSGAMGVRTSKNVELENDLRRGIHDGEIETWFQPIFRADGALYGAEALVRWNHREHGILGPGAFIPLSEATGLILPIGRSVLLDATRATAEFGDGLSISVNLSARQFVEPGLDEEIAEVLRASGLAAKQLCLEVTESTAVRDVRRTTETLESLRRLGVRVAIDDFGTGYSSLNHLKQLPVDIVKIDKSFVGGIGTDRVDTAIVDATVRMASAIGMAVVAEGVETEGQLEHLRASGCPLIQGFLLARPMPEDAYRRVIASSRVVAAG